MKEEEIKQLKWVVKTMQRELGEEHSLLLDIYGMAFYYDTGIWPLFKSAPIEMAAHFKFTDEERSAKFQEWMKKLNELLA